MGSPTARRPGRRRGLVFLFVVLFIASSFPAVLSAAEPPPGVNLANHDPEVTPARKRKTKIPGLPGGVSRLEEQLLKRDDAFITARTAGDNPLSVVSAGRARAHRDAGGQVPEEGRPADLAADLHRSLDRDQPEPDRPGDAREQLVLRRERPHRRPCDPAEHRPEDPGRGPGWHLDLSTRRPAPGSRARTPCPPFRSATSPWRRRTT